MSVIVHASTATQHSPKCQYIVLLRTIKGCNLVEKRYFMGLNFMYSNGNMVIFHPNCSIRGGFKGGGGAPPPIIGKNMIFLLKIVIFHTKYMYPIILSAPPLTGNPGSAPVYHNSSTCRDNLEYKIKHFMDLFRYEIQF